MKMITLLRTYHADCTIGEMLDEKLNVICFTLEEPWKNNQQRISCIPESLYTCKPYDGLHFKDVWQISNVENRSYVLIHNGNTTRDTEGCVLVGRKMGALNGMPAVLESRLALEALKEFVGRDANGKLNQFVLKVTNKL